MIVFGVLSQALINSTEQLSVGGLLKHVFNNAFWPIFGEFEILNDFIYEKCDDSDNEEKKCLISTNNIVTYTVLMVYIIFTNVLLLNLLIAIFK